MNGASTLKNWISNFAHPFEKSHMQRKMLCEINVLLSDPGTNDGLYLKYKRLFDTFSTKQKILSEGPDFCLQQIKDHMVLIKAEPGDMPPGIRKYYSNAFLDILGKVSKEERFEEYMRRQLLKHWKKKCLSHIQLESRIREIYAEYERGSTCKSNWYI